MQEPTSTETASAVAGQPRHPRVRFGIFDWLDAQPQRDLATLYEERLQVMEYADTAGFDY